MEPTITALTATLEAERKTRKALEALIEKLLIEREELEKNLEASRIVAQQRLAEILVLTSKEN